MVRASRYNFIDEYAPEDLHLIQVLQVNLNIGLIGILHTLVVAPTPNASLHS